MGITTQKLGRPSREVSLGTQDLSRGELPRENFKGVYSASINIQYRLTLEFIIEDALIVPVNIGSHDKVY